MPLRERKRAQLRERIERAALRLFAEQGYDRTTVAQIASEADVAERTFHLHFASKEDVVLGDIHDEMQALAAALAQRPPGTGVLDTFRLLGDRRIELFRRNGELVRARRAVEDASPQVHSRAVLAREQAERELLTPAFAADLGLPGDAPQVVLLVAAFTGISGALDALFHASPDDRAARAVLDHALDALSAAEQALRPSDR